MTRTQRLPSFSSKRAWLACGLLLAVAAIFVHAAHVHGSEGGDVPATRMHVGATGAGLPRHEAGLSAHRAEAVKRTVRSVWGAYRKYAWGADEYNTVRHTPIYWDAHAKQAVTLVDALDTLHFCGLSAEYAEAVGWLKAEFDYRPTIHVNVFETTIRVIGGLLAAHALTGDRDLLEFATRVADALAPVYNQSNLENGTFPRSTYNPASQQPGGSVLLADLGSVQLEYRYLSRATGNRAYAQRADSFFLRAIASTRQSGMLGQSYSAKKGFSTRVGTGGPSDSYYEYLLKMYLLTGEKERVFVEAWGRAADAIAGVLAHPFREGSSSEMWIRLGDLNRTDGTLDACPTDHTFEHLSCFVPGMLALGAQFFDAGRASRHMRVAKGVLRLCVNLYFNSTTGLAPEAVKIHPETKRVFPFRPNYLLRPETAESLFYLWRATRDPVYRDWGWRIFEAIERHCQVCRGCEVSGYSEISDVHAASPRLTGRQESFFIAETLKYLFLLFSDDAVLDLDCWVLNTEGHPFPKFAPEGKRANIPEKCKKV
ncbi:Mannosyl-oligosaccharide alpha-1 [Diplonema papillatum]|nr:Mannosyl-oligosaccharide alpha-1 [Diplonema papillatum]